MLRNGATGNPTTFIPVCLTGNPEQVMARDMGVEAELLEEEGEAEGEEGEGGCPSVRVQPYWHHQVRLQDLLDSALLEGSGAQ